MLLTEYRPQPKLVTKTTITTRPRFPVIDTHNHLGGGFGGGWHRRPVAELLEALDAAGVLCYMDLDGSWSEDILQGWLDKFKAAVPDRFYFFGGVNWDVWPEQGNRFGESAAGRLRAQVAWGAQGLKIWKVFGPRGRDQRGHLVAVNDSRLVPLWETAAELNIPVLIHVADPAAFFDPLDPGNERRGEFQVHREWHFPSPPFPAFLTIIEQFAHLVQRHPQTKFIGAHVGGYAENLGWIGQLLDNCPNFYVDISARTCELRRQPYTARRFCLDYADRILFGADTGPELDTYRLYYRFLESDDEYFNYSPGEIPSQGRWHIYGLFLPRLCTFLIQGPRCLLDHLWN